MLPAFPSASHPAQLNMLSSLSQMWDHSSLQVHSGIHSKSVGALPQSSLRCVVKLGKKWETIYLCIHNRTTWPCLAASHLEVTSGRDVCHEGCSLLGLVSVLFSLGSGQNQAKPLHWQGYPNGLGTAPTLAYGALSPHYWNSMCPFGSWGNGLNREKNLSPRIKMKRHWVFLSLSLKFQSPNVFVASFIFPWLWVI